MTYTITKNNQFDSLEITFDGKPSEEIRNALKALKFRWHSVKKVWYGYAAEHEVINAILGNSTEEEPASVYTDGYLGGGAVYGSKRGSKMRTIKNRTYYNFLQVRKAIMAKGWDAQTAGEIARNIFDQYEMNPQGLTIWGLVDLVALNGIHSHEIR